MELAEARYSVRKYQDRQVSDGDLQKVIRAAMLAPTGKNSQPFRIYVLKSKEAVSRMSELSPCVFGAPMVLLFTYSRKEEWNNPLEKGVHSGDQDVSIAATHAMMEAADIGLGTCWCNYFSNSEAEKAFGIPSDERCVLFMPIGYPAEDSVPSKMHTDCRPVNEVVRYLRSGVLGPVPIAVGEAAVILPVDHQIRPAAEIQTVQEIDAGIVQAEPSAVEDRPQEALVYDVHGGTPEHPVECGHHQEGLGELLVPLAALDGEPSAEPAWFRGPAAHAVLEHHRGMVMGHHQGLAGHDLLRRPCVAVDEAHTVPDEAGGGPYPDPAGQELLYLRIVIAADNGDLREPFQKGFEEIGYLGELLLGGARDGILHIADDDQLVDILVRGRDYGIQHILRMGDQMESLGPQVRFHPYVQIPDDQGSAGPQGRYAVDRLEIYHLRPSLRTSGIPSATSVAMRP